MRRLLIASSALITLTPLLASAAPQTFAERVGFLIGYINIIIPIIISAAVLCYIYNTGQGMWDRSKGLSDTAWKDGMMWGIITITIMVSIWGILSILANTFQIPLTR